MFTSQSIRPGAYRHAPTLLALALGSLTLNVLADDSATLTRIDVTGQQSWAEQHQLPQTTASVTRKDISTSINATDTEDALKYMPSVLVRKRFIGDTQAPMATRTTGINASARSLIYADGLLLSTLINNNNGNGSPQWFMVTPDQIDRIDVMYGPFAAQFPGNSWGAVTQITTRMPTRLEGSVDVSVSTQPFKLYGYSSTEPAEQYSANIGNRSGDWSWWLSASHLDSFSQPLSFATVSQSITPASSNLPVVTGAYADHNRTGGAIQVFGAGNLVHTLQDNASLKLAYDFPTDVRALYTLGYWQNSSKATAQSWLQTAEGTPYYGASSGSINLGGYAYSASSLAGQFSSNNVEQQHLMQGLTVGTRHPGVFDWQVAISQFTYLEDESRLSTGLYPAALSGGPGRTTDMQGTGWVTGDVQGIWRPDGPGGTHAFSAGVHADQFKLSSPTYTTSNWVSGDNGALYGNALGKTRTSAFWAQDVWRLAPDLSATLGLRYEQWHAFDGYNFATTSKGTGIGINQPGVTDSGFSPKFSMTWAASEAWTVTGSFGKALRFPTVGELYQSVQTGTTYVQANPYLKPESVLSGELAIVRDTGNGPLRLSVFDESVSDALISQTANIAGYATPVSFTQNVTRTRETGVELALDQDHVFVRPLSLSGSVTWADSRIVADDGFVSTTPGSSAVGKQVPYIPTWRATLAGTWHFDERLAATLAGRYSSRMYATVDNSDVNASTYQGFDQFLVLDARLAWQIDTHWQGAVGIDNLNNRKYFLYHPFPQRTFYAQLKYAL
ncbi:TonB-dependent receptor [Silvimonas amylolytica]|uniref:TonB-dependent receptor n=1 Tax=Silvimonas amylolytica TaxID=449663 RepID=A0ABQ2PRR3_9NEIS|nr:TonB-dependent receptor [Silvimonas amylolytica]GGP27953.1 TonB-dependent receptor [Silvimonas amylolytica]